MWLFFRQDAAPGERSNLLLLLPSLRAADLSPWVLQWHSLALQEPHHWLRYRYQHVCSGWPLVVAPHQLQHPANKRAELRKALMFWGSRHP